MALTLKAKLIAATVASIATITGLVGAIGYCASALTEELRQSRQVTTALRNYLKTDIAREALRADAYMAVQLGAAQEPLGDVLDRTRRHVLEYRLFVAENQGLDLPADVRAPLDALRAPMAELLQSVEAITATAAQGQDVPAAQLRAFDRQFQVLESAEDEVAGRIEQFARARDAAGDLFSARIDLFSTLGLVLGLAIAGLLGWTTRRDVLAPLAALSGALAKISKGEYDVALPTRRGDEIGEIARTVAAFSRDAAERLGVSQLNEWLQSAKSEAELYAMIAEFLTRFLPNCRGSIYVYANSRDMLECTKAWNGPASAATMHPDDCWGLRRGRTYIHGGNDIAFHCAHVGPDVGEDYCCIPILAHGETVGLLHVEHAPAGAGRDRAAVLAEQRRLVQAAVEHISLAIANVKLRDQLRDQSIRDVLTGLFNRRYLLETGRREFQRAARSGQPVAILSIDVDHFKAFNDNHGHDAGDAVLRNVGEALAATFRGDDVACRYGGEEFVALLPGASPAAAAARAEQIRGRIEALSVRYADGNLPRVTVSVGVAAYPQSGATLTEVLKAADDALYRAKGRGRNCVDLATGLKAAAAGATEPAEVEELVDWLEAIAGPQEAAAVPPPGKDEPAAA